MKQECGANMDARGTTMAKLCINVEEHYSSCSFQVEFKHLRRTVLPHTYFLAQECLMNYCVTYSCSTIHANS